MAAIPVYFGDPDNHPWEVVVRAGHFGVRDNHPWAVVVALASESAKTGAFICRIKMYPGKC